MPSDTVPKAALYYFSGSIFASAALLTIEEKGYGEDEIDLKFVDISKGENFDPTFLRLNPNGTVPTLVVPIEKTLQADMEVRYKALTDTKSIVEFLDKSRSALSKTHTTSSAPAPSLAPATIAFSATCNNIISIISSVSADPNTLWYLQARTDEELAKAAEQVVPFLAPRRATLQNHLTASSPEKAESDGFVASEKTRTFWAAKLAATNAFLAVYEQARTPASQLTPEDAAKRQEYFEQSKLAWETGLQAALVKLSQEIIGPLALGDQLSLADMHLGPWLARVALLSGAQYADSGAVAIAKIEARVGSGFSLPREITATGETQRTPTAGIEVAEPAKQAKLAAFWDTIRERPSWQKVYASGLH